MILDNFGFHVLGTNDYSKLFFWMPKVLLSRIYLWPVGENSSTCRKVSSVISTMICIFLAIGLANKIIVELDDFDETIRSMGFIASISESILKILSLTYHAKAIKLILNDIMGKFLPHDLFGTDDSLTKSLKGLYKIVVSLMMILTFCGSLYATLCSLSPLIADEKILPFPANYPFDHLVSPIYEIMYVLHVATFAFIMIPGVIGFDLLLMAICASIVGQYKILQKSFAIFNTERMYGVNQTLKILYNDRLDTEYNAKKKYLVFFIKHHQCLISLLERTNRVFSFLEMAHLVISALSICIGLLLTNQANITTGQYLSAVFFTGCIMFQLFLYCEIGNELYLQASLLPQYIFQSNWITLSDTALKKDVMFILMMSQQAQELTSYKVFRMDIFLVVRVVRLSFSGYTLLSTMTKK